MRAGIALPLIAVATLAARLPLAFLPRPYGDEMMYALVGHQWLAGHLPYTLLWDVKPPGLFGLYAISEAVTGDPLPGVWLLPLLACFGTAVALWRISTAWFGDARMGLVAGLLYPPFTLVLEGVMGTSELLVAPFVCFGLLLAGRAGAGAALAGGLLFGIAGSIKQVAIFEALLGFVILLGVERRVTRIALFGLGAAAPLGLLWAWYAAVGQAMLFLDSVLFAAARRTEGDGVTLAEGFWRFLPMLRPLLPLVVLGCFAWTERRWFRERRAPARYGWLGGWLLAASAGILLLRAMYDHYYLTLLPPLVLAASLFLAEFSRRVAWARGRARLTLALAALWLFPSGWITLNGQWPLGDREAEAIVAALRDNGLRAGEGELFVADHELALYLLTQTVQPTQFPFPQHLTCDFPLPPGVDPAKELDRIMAGRPRFVVVTANRARFVCTRPDRMAIVGRALDAGYDRVAVVGDPRDAVEVWRRR